MAFNCPHPWTQPSAAVLLGKPTSRTRATKPRTGAIKHYFTKSNFLLVLFFNLDFPFSRHIRFLGANASYTLRIKREASTVVLAINLCQYVNRRPSTASPAADRALTQGPRVGTSTFRGRVRGVILGFLLYSVYTAEIKEIENWISVPII